MGLWYLPVSKYSLIYASQLAFNVFFSYFLNSQKFTPSVINSLILLVSHEDSSTPNGVSRGKSVIRFICTIVASAGNGLYLSLTHFCFQKVIKRESFYQSLVASSAIMLGLFVTGEWKSLKGEMEEHELGKTSYIMVLVWMCILWQGFTIGSTALLSWCYSDPSCYLSHVYQHYLDDRESKSEHTKQ